MTDALTVGIEPLTEDETEQLAVCESEIADGLTTFWDVGRALAQISAKRLYREKFETFQIYCKERWNITRQHAYRLIEAVDVFENVSPVGDIKTERQARAIKHFEKEMQGVVWQIAEKTAPLIAGKPKVSAGQLQAVGEVLSAFLVEAGLDDGSGEVKPIGQLLDANITEVVYERMMRQKEIVREKLSRNGAKSPSSNGDRPNTDKESSTGESPATAKPAASVTPVDVKVRLVLRLVATMIAGIDKEMLDRQTALHPAIYASYHFGKVLLGQEKHDETEIRKLGSSRIDECDFCGTLETMVSDWIFTNSSTQRLSSARLALCEACVENYNALNEGSNHK